MPAYLFQRIGVLDEVTVEEAESPEHARQLIEKMGIVGKGGEFVATRIRQVVEKGEPYSEETSEDILGAILQGP